MISQLKNIFSKTSKGLVLMYHRIADVTIDPWDLCVCPVNFEQQIKYLNRTFKIIPMYEFADRTYKRKSLKNCVAITFDDGYLDNFTLALPVLENYKCPAAFFLTGKLIANPAVAFDIGKNTPGLSRHYWWDELEQLILTTPVLPQLLNLPVGDALFSFFLGDDNTLTETMEKEISIWRESKPFYNNRIKLFTELSALLKTLHPVQQIRVMDDLKAWAGVESMFLPLLMDTRHIRQLTSNALFEIGAHSVNHPALGYLNESDQKEEITGSKNIFESFLNTNLRGFAYPHGHFNEHTRAIVESAGFTYAVSTTEKKTAPDSDRYDIPRLHVKNWTSETLQKKIGQLK